MARIVLTEEIARADAQDTANRQMRKAGRTRWNADDANTAAERLCKLMQRIDPELAAAYARDLGVTA